MRVCFLFSVVLLGLAGFSTVLAEAEVSTPATDAPAAAPAATTTELEEGPSVATAEDEPEEPEEEPAEPETTFLVASDEEEDEDDAVVPEPEDDPPAATTTVADVASEPAVVDDDGTEVSGAGDVTKAPTADEPTGATVTETFPPDEDEADLPAAFTAPPEPEEADDDSAADEASEEEDYMYVSTEGDEWIDDKYDYSDDVNSTGESGESSILADGDDDDDVAETTRGLDGTVFVEPGSGAGAIGGGSWVAAAAFTGVAATAALLL